MNEKWWKNAVVYQIYPRSFKDKSDKLGTRRDLDVSGL